ncbi:MAG: DUF3515 domain-containing protein [Rhodococcus sp. (in: high G+C Gram-positive bacteria)]|uniref:DUF3515 domain-containing protein n=1 Tax=Rhodococcus sp. TaxID=1831 RepID=UPI003BB1D4DB
MSDPESAPEEYEIAERHNPALIATAVALPVALVIGIIVAAVMADRTPVKEPVSLGVVPAPASGSPECVALMAILPDSLGEYTRAELAEPAPESSAAWQADEGEPLVLRCGLDRPAEFDQASALTVIDGVQWFEISGSSAGIDASSWYAVDRGVYVGFTVPTGVGPTPLQDVSAAVSAALPPEPLDPAPVPN